MGSFSERPSGRNGWRYRDAVAGEGEERQDVIAAQLHRLFDGVVREPIPDGFLHRLEEEDGSSSLVARIDSFGRRRRDVE